MLQGLHSHTNLENTIAVTQSILTVERGSFPVQDWLDTVMLFINIRNYSAVLNSISQRLQVVARVKVRRLRIRKGIMSGIQF